jgi:DNA-binding NtrC family response regulator
MSQQSSVLIISHQRAMRHLAEQVCRQAGAKTVTATSGQEGSAIAAERGLHGFSLVVIDTADPGQNTPWQPRMACQLLQEWTAVSPSLPFVFVGPESQKQALRRIRADSVRFVTPPFNRHTVRQAIESCLPSSAWMARGFAARLPNKGTSNGRYYVLEGNYSAITGWRRGSFQEITQHAIHCTEELNARSTNGLSHWTYRRKTSY